MKKPIPFQTQLTLAFSDLIFPVPSPTGMFVVDALCLKEQNNSSHWSVVVTMNTPCVHIAEESAQGLIIDTSLRRGRGYNHMVTPQRQQPTPLIRCSGHSSIPTLTVNVLFSVFKCLLDYIFHDNHTHQARGCHIFTMAAVMMQ